MHYVDLHLHTNHSDGTATVEEVLREADRQGLSVISVSDHNTVDAYDEIMERRALFGGKILPGAELATVYRQEMIEIHGYGVDLAAIKKQIGQTYLTFYEKQVKEAAMDVSAVLASGATLDKAFADAMLHTPKRVFDPAHETNRPYLLRELQRHPENARFFESREEFETIDPGVFSRKYLFNAESALYSDQSALFPSPKRLIDMIHQCGGLAFLSHPFVYGKRFTDRPEEWLTLGIDGVECMYGTFTDSQICFLSEFCDRNHLYKSGGSDFHGLDMRPKNRLGFANERRIPQTLTDPWLNKLLDRLL